VLVVHAADARREQWPARRLVEAGADTQALTNGGGTLLHLAASSGNADTVRFVLPFCNVEQVDNNGVTAAQLAANEQTAAFDDVLDALLVAGAKLNTLAVDGQDEPKSPFAGASSRSSGSSSAA
jgi:ankyrin repeat protein